MPDVPNQRRRGLGSVLFVALLMVPWAFMYWNDHLFREYGPHGEYSGRWAIAGVFELAGYACHALAFLYAILITLRKRTEKRWETAVWAVILLSALLVLIIGVPKGPSW